MLPPLRYLSIIKVLHKVGYIVGKHSIAEIGVGDSGISYYLKSKFIGCDLIINKNPPKEMLPVQCNALALPFKDRTFDFIISSDMMEHIPEKMRETAMTEMIRVTSRCLILAFPNGEKAKECDVKIFKNLKSNGKKVPQWLLEHLQDGNNFPSVEGVRRFFDRNGFKYNVYRNENLLVHYFGVKMEFMDIVKKIEWLTRGLPVYLAWKPFLSLINRGKAYRCIFAVYRN